MSILSIIVPTRDRYELLLKLFKSLLSQSLTSDKYEIVVVDNGSVDSTKKVCSEYRKFFPNYKYFYEKKPGLHVGRHRGLQEASSDLLVFCDDDIEAIPTWLQAINDSFDDKEVVMVGGKCLPKFETDPPPSWLNAMWAPNATGQRVLGYLSLIDLGDDIKLVNPNHIYGCNFAIRRSVLLEAGGFHPDAMPQELIRFRGDGETFVSEYIQKKGYKSLYNPLASIYHWVPASRMTMEYFCRRAYNQGISDSYTAIRYAKGLDPQLAKRNIIQHFSQRLRSKSIPGILRVAARIARSLVHYDNGQGSLACEEALLRRNLDTAYQKGYAYHQAQVRESPELLAWVLRPDYWDCRIPSVGSGE